MDEALEKFLSQVVNNSRHCAHCYNCTQVNGISVCCANAYECILYEFKDYDEGED